MINRSVLRRLSRKREARGSAARRKWRRKERARSEHQKKARDGSTGADVARCSRYRGAVLCGNPRRGGNGAFEPRTALVKFKAWVSRAWFLAFARSVGTCQGAHCNRRQQPPAPAVGASRRRRRSWPRRSWPRPPAGAGHRWRTHGAAAPHAAAGHFAASLIATARSRRRLADDHEHSGILAAAGR